MSENGLPLEQGSRQDKATETSRFPADLEVRYQKERETIIEMYKKVWVWHGTGRCEETDNGVKDTLVGLINAGELSPHHDIANGSKAVETISATQSRPYATMYSDIHLQQGSPDLLFKDERTSDLISKTLKRSARYLPSVILNIGYILRQKKEVKRWMVGHTGQAISGNVWLTAAWFGNLRSILPGDYPILIGLISAAFEPMKTVGYLRATEVRTDQPIALYNISHLEVPLKYEGQTRALLNEKGIFIPVLPRELGERYSTELSDRELIIGHGFTQNKR